ncbi:hypothetical protein CHCC14814_2423 [Bacillus paralicheniformis]|nr:hypothetical protein CHCC14814_2423 [Bacillus paralicheniformis]
MNEEEVGTTPLFFEEYNGLAEGAAQRSRWSFFSGKVFLWFKLHPDC